MRKLRIVSLAATAVLIGTGAATLGPAAQASASPKCHVWEQNTTRFSGWCDGRGPASYRATITCRHGGEHQGQWHWLGDRRGSTAWCEKNDRVASKWQFISG
ncbi:hypothetical protein ACFYZ9_39190 [Streptomyces sp. NPDC001691]|uniref:hypothetical protein n=1 Tax=unclassified Streptomyces TaxID=2593676 RepID=UPI000DEAA695|nr:hypothetical protein [Streptomyces sp. SDr-06]RCH67481.1 hypothetical protein DT019_17905 [Streptomyces sp. SDr-06]